MAHNALILEKGDFVYVGMLLNDGKYVEVQISNIGEHLIVNRSTADDDIVVTTR